MDRVQLPQGLSHSEEAVYFLPLSFQKFLVLILSTSEGWRAESTLEPPSGYEHRTPGLGIQQIWLGSEYASGRRRKYNKNTVQKDS